MKLAAVVLLVLFSVIVADKVLRVDLPTDDHLMRLHKVTSDTVDIWSNDGNLVGIELPFVGVSKQI